MANDNIDTKQMQVEADNAKESLGLANFFLEQMMPKDIPEAPQEPQNAPGGGLEPKPEETPMEDSEIRIKEMEAGMDKKMEDMKKELQDMVKKEIGMIKESISEALEND